MKTLTPKISRLAPFGLYGDEPIAFGVIAQNPTEWSNRDRARAIRFYRESGEERYADRIAYLEAAEPSDF